MVLYRIPNANRGICDDPIWLYRRLIRQARALYDDVARDYFTRYIRQTYRGHSKEPPGQRLVTYIRAARSGSAFLARANAGYTRPLTKVLGMAYGRSGKRRHELLEPIYSYGKPVVTPDDPRRQLPYMSVKMKALLEWAKVKNINIKVPEVNIWDQPFPTVREPRLYQLAHRRLKDACPAPLPMDEYERLKRFANGEELPKPSRRKVEPLLVADLKAGRVKELQFQGRPHEMTPRSWRRMWQRVLVQIPALQFNEESNKWEVISTNFDLEIPDGEAEEFGLVVDDIQRSKSVRQKQCK